jgi:hypothetical protein
MTEAGERAITVSFFTIPEGHRPQPWIRWFVASYSIYVALAMLLLHWSGVPGTGPSGALAATATFIVTSIPFVAVAYFARCTCTITSTAVILRTEGIFGPADSTPLADVLSARVLPGPILELDLRSGVPKRIGPWKTFTTFEPWDRRNKNCQVLLEAINEQFLKTDAYQPAGARTRRPTSRGSQTAAPRRDLQRPASRRHLTPPRFLMR